MRAGLGASAFLLVFAAGCGDTTGMGGPPDAVDVERLGLRPSDGLLENSALQEVVALQIDRDAVGLINLLSDADPAVRARAAFALGSLQDGGAVTGLLQALADPEPLVRADAAFALGQLVDYSTGHTELAQGLLAALETETDILVRRRLLNAVGMAGTEPVAQQFAGMTFSAAEMPHVVLALSRIGLREAFEFDYGTIVDWLSRQLQDPDPNVRWAAAYYFGRVDVEDAWVQQAGNVERAIEALSPDDPAAVPLINAIEDRVGRNLHEVYRQRAIDGPDWRVRHAVARVLPLLPMEQPGVVGAIMAALDDSSFHVRSRLASTFSTILQAPDPIKEPMKEWIRTHRSDWELTVDLLPPLARGGETEFAFAWMDTLAAISDDAIEAGLLSMSEVASPELLSIYMDYGRGDNPDRARAAWAALAARWQNEPIDSVNVQRYFAIFSEGLDHPDPAVVRSSAIAMADTALQQAGSYDVVRSGLADAVAAGDEDRAGALGRGLVAMDGEGLAEALAPLADHPDPSVRRPVRVRLRSLGVEVDLEVGESEAQPAAVDWERLSALGRHPRLIVQTDRGTFTAVLDAELAPLTVDAITRYAEAGAYDGIPFHRVVSDFVVQGGDFSLGSGAFEADLPMRSELTGVPYLRGVLGMARTNQMDSESSQFFVTHSPQPHLDQGYGAFGWVIEGMDVVDLIEQDDRIVSIRVEPGDSPTDAVSSGTE